MPERYSFAREVVAPMEKRVKIMTLYIGGSDQA
jgi:hypothetical protein